MWQDMMYRSNRLSCVQVHGMEDVHGMERGDCWCHTLVVIGGHPTMGPCAPPSSRIPLIFRCIVGHLYEHRGHHGALRSRTSTTRVGLIQNYDACLWHLVRMEHIIRNA